MSESKTPVIHITGTVTEKDYTNAVRARGIRFCLKYTIIYLILMFVFEMGISFYYWYPDLKDGYVTCAEWLSEAWRTVFRASLSTYMIIGFLAVYAVFEIVIRPILAQKRLREFHPDGFPVTYDFFDDTLVISSATKTSDETFRLKYADVQRKIRETRYTIALSTGQRNRIGLYKAVMAPEETEQVRKLLNERCPQRKKKT